MSPETARLYKEFHNTPVTITNSRIQAKPFSEELKENAKAFHDRWVEKEALARSIYRRSLDYDEASTASQESFLATGEEMEELDALIESYREFILTPDYDCLAHSLIINVEELDPIFGNHINTYQIDIMTYFLFRRATLQFQNGDTEKALEWFALPFHSLKANGYICDELLRMQNKICLKHCFQWYKVIEQCNSPELLRSILSQQNAIRPLDPDLPPDQYWMNADALEGFRIAALHGIHIPASLPSLTGNELSIKSRQILAEWVDTILLPSCSNPNKKEALLSSLEVMAKLDGLDPAIAKKHSLFNLRLNRYIEPVMSSGYANFFSYFSTDKLDYILRNSLTRYDLLRSQTAARIFELENGRPPSGWNDLVPALLDTVPIDLFSPNGDEIAFGPPFHSIGKDGVDQHPFDSSVDVPNDDIVLSIPFEKGLEY